MTASVAVVILNWKNAPATIACVESLKAVDYPGVSIIVVDNGSEDGSVQAIHARWPDLTVLEIGQNLGYAGGNNVGIRYVLEHGADYVCVLNNDVTVEPGFLQPLVTASSRLNRWHITTPMMCETAQPDRIWAMGVAIDWRTAASHRLRVGEHRADWQDHEPYEVGFAVGAAILVPRAVWEQVGLIDESFFLYYEETDWCMRAHRQGFKILVVPASCIWHDAEAGGGRTSPQVTYYMTRNALRLLQRNLAGHQRLMPMIRVAALAHWYALGDVRRGQTARARARVLGVFDFLRGKSGPRRSEVSVKSALAN